MRKDGESEPVIVVITEEELNKCLLALHDTQHRAIFRFMTDLGLSLPEILGDEKLGLKGIYIQDIDTDAMTIKVHYRFVKEDRLLMREVPLSTDTLVAVRDYLSSMALTFNDKGKMFEITDRRVRQCLAELSEKCTPGKDITQLMLRRTAIVRMLRDGVREDEVRRRMGFLQKREEVLVMVASYFQPTVNDYHKLVYEYLFENNGGTGR